MNSLVGREPFRTVVEEFVKKPMICKKNTTEAARGLRKHRQPPPPIEARVGKQLAREGKNWPTAAKVDAS